MRWLLTKCHEQTHVPKQENIEVVLNNYQLLFLLSIDFATISTLAANIIQLLSFLTHIDPVTGYTLSILFTSITAFTFRDE